MGMLRATVVPLMILYVATDLCRVTKRLLLWVLLPGWIVIAAVFTRNNALSALEKGLLTQGDIDKALVNIFTTRMRIGEFSPKKVIALCRNQTLNYQRSLTIMIWHSRLPQRPRFCCKIRL